MKKVIIISYFFPPANFVGSQRSEAWAKHLHKTGVYPIIITRNWNDNQSSITEEVTNNQYSIETTKEFEVRRLPYKRSLRDKCAKYALLRPIQKVLTLWELVMSNYFIKALPYSNFYKEAHSLLSSDDQIAGIITSGRPFQSFFIGSKLKNKFPQLKWIPDYRDEWNTRSTNKPQGVISNFLSKLENISENKWTANADFFISVSDTWVKNISSKINKKGVIIKNGYDGEISIKKNTTNSKKFTILYIGTLYPYQPIEIFIEALKELPNVTKEKLKIYFIGTSPSNKAEQRLINLTDGEDSLFKLIPRIPITELKLYLEKSDIALATSYNTLKGCIPVKVYDYFVNGIPILLTPSDDDLLADFIKTTNSGFVISTKEELKIQLQNWVIDKENGKTINYTPNLDVGKHYSREHQTSLLGKLLASDFNSELP